MKKALAILSLGIFFLSACASGPAGHVAHTDEIGAHDYWARSALKGGNTAIYLFLYNQTAEADALIGASTDVAEAVEVHLSQMDANDVMSMTKQESVELPAQGEVEFAPGGYHFMVLGLKQDLKAGAEITLTLHFKHHADITLTVPVMDGTDTDGMDMNH
ncbi:MAG: copper chaperone PCu(A)C [Anaerolineales bacterium]|nr:copper chaperone PCu(A)C [Anaerolineales bacterium]